MSVSDTIFGLSTAQGRAGVAVIRVSGRQSRNCVEALAGALPQPRLAKLCSLRDPETSALLDRALVLFFPAPNSFTGEDCAELHVHGSRAVVAAVERVLSRIEGVRLAAPGEFTLRAYRNGKMSLSEVEALADLLAAESELQRRVATDGSIRLRNQINEWRKKLISLLSLLEAMIDFSDEDDVQITFDSDVKHEVAKLQVEMDAFYSKSALAERVRSGFTVAILGPPNAGKSTLLNRLIGRNIALTSDEPGTTRDIVQGLAELGGIPVTFLDTAGLREMPTSPVEAAGIALSREAASAADLVLWVCGVDHIEPSPEPDYLVVLTKGDLAPHVVGAISAHSGDGIDSLVEQIRDRLGLAVMPALEGALAVSDRQRLLIDRAQGHLHRSLGFGAAGLDRCAEEVRLCASALESVIGRIAVDDVLDMVFSRFCIGK